MVRELKRTPFLEFFIILITKFSIDKNKKSSIIIKQVNKWVISSVGRAADS